MIFLKNILTKNSSLIVLVFGAGGFFISNLLLKNFFTSSDYGAYSLLVTYFSILFIISVLGLEQVFLRYSKRISAKKLTTDSLTFKSMVCSSLLVAIIGTLVFNILYDIVLNMPLLLIASIGICFSTILFTTHRLQENFSISQWIVNYWKIGLVVFVILGFVGLHIDYEIVFYGLCGAIILFSFISSYLTLNTIHIVKEKQLNHRQFFESFAWYFVSIVLFTFLNFSDRLFVEYHFGLEELGNYFFLNNFFLAPFLLLQNYVGFKQLVYFKTNFNWSIMHRNLLKSLVLGVVLSSILMLLGYAIDALKLFNLYLEDNIMLIGVLLLLGCLRLCSAMVSAAFEVLIEIKYLRLFNLIFVGIVLFAGSILYHYKVDLVTIMMIFVVLWGLRMGIQYYLLTKSIRRNASTISI